MKVIQCQCIPDVERDQVNLFVKTPDGSWTRIGVLYNTDMSMDRIKKVAEQVESLINRYPIDLP